MTEFSNLYKTVRGKRKLYVDEIENEPQLYIKKESIDLFSTANCTQDDSQVSSILELESSNEVTEIKNKNLRRLI